MGSVLVFSSRRDFAKGLTQTIKCMNDKITTYYHHILQILSSILHLFYRQNWLTELSTRVRETLNLLFDSDDTVGFFSSFTIVQTNHSIQIQFLYTKIIYKSYYQPQLYSVVRMFPVQCALLCVMFGLGVLFEFCGCDLLIS